jgi:hypothetical protein
VKGLRGALEQPLFYFALLGVLVFLVDLALQGGSDAAIDREAIRREVAVSLKKDLSRPPTPKELERGIEEWLDTELLFREAMALKLDENDSVIRQQLAQKLEHIVRQRTVIEPPNESELRARLRAHPNRYNGVESFDVTHVFVKKSVSPESYEERVSETLKRIQAGENAETAGDHFPRGPKFTRLTRTQLQRIFQARLSAVLDPRRVGEWQVVHGLRGAHLLRLDAARDGKADFEKLRPALEADVREERQRAALGAYLAELRKKYDVDVGATP